jgi:copper(I)-binding protein
MIAALIASALLVVTGGMSHPATDTAAVYFTIKNAGPADTLVGAQTTIAGKTTMHKSMNKMASMSGMSEVVMDQVSSVPVPANGEVAFKMGGYHVMLDELAHPLKAGDTFTLRLHFTHAGWIDVPVSVQPY